MIIDGASHIANWKDYEGRTALHLGKSTVCQKYNRCCIDGHPITFPPADLGNQVLFYRLVIDVIKLFFGGILENLDFPLS